MTAESIRGIQDGRKTVTRQVIKPQPEYKPAPVNSLRAAGWEWHSKKEGLSSWVDKDKFSNEMTKFCPYGGPGDLLWIKEGWRCTGGGSDRNIIYRADGDTAISFCGIDDGRKSILHVAEPYWAEWDRLVYETNKGCEWRSPYYMPKWAARLWRKVVSVRAEQLQEITEEDAIAEGIQLYEYGTGYDKDYGGRDKNMAYSVGYGTERLALSCMSSNASGGYRRLWNRLNAKRGYPWNPDLWVWRIEFEEYSKNQR